MIQWRAHEVAKIPEGYQVAVADVNGDGRLDILALSSAKSIVEWYENPTWKPRPITTTTHKNISLAPLFHPGYPARGLALASDFALDDSTHGGSLWWAEPAADWDRSGACARSARFPLRIGCAGQTWTARAAWAWWTRRCWALAQWRRNTRPPPR